MGYWIHVPPQTILGSGEDGEPIGDCFRCCIAAVIGVRADTVPHFMEIAQNDTGGADMIAQRWLHARKFWLIQSAGASVCGVPWYVPGFMTQYMAPFPVIHCGPTVRSKHPGQTHCVVMNGHALLYDPHPSRAGLLATTSQYIILPHL